MQHSRFLQALLEMEACHHRAEEIDPEAYARPLNIALRGRRKRAYDAALRELEASGRGWWWEPCVLSVSPGLAALMPA